MTCFYFWWDVSCCSAAESCLTLCNPVDYSGMVDKHPKLSALEFFKETEPVGNIFATYEIISLNKLIYKEIC